MTVNTLTLPNGVRIVSERLPYVRSATLGVWFGCGSRYETANINGVSHFIEHMLFKGTSNFTAAQLAERMDELGGGFNAFTSKEATSFYVKSLDTNILESAKVLCEMIFDSSFDPRELETERSVIFEEIDMYEDTPDDLAAERLIAGAFKGSPLSRPILGKRSTLEKMTPDTLRDYMRQHYMGKNTVVSISGSFTDEVTEYLADAFSSMEPGKLIKPKRAEYQKCKSIKKKRSNRTTFVLAFPATPI